MSNKIKVRFNLGRGENYMKWKIESKNSGVEYHSPCDVQLVMKGCQLKNNRKTAEKIFNGMNKNVCAWVLCDSVSIRHSDNVKNIPFNTVWVKDRVRYNPRKFPHWVNYFDNDVDNCKFDEITTIDYCLYAK